MHNNPKSTNSCCWCELTLAEWAAEKQEGITRKRSFEAAEFSPIFRSHFTCLSSTCPTTKRRKVSFALQEARAYTWCIACPKVTLLFTCMCVCACAQSSLGVSLMALRYICLVSVRPGYKWSSQAELTSLIYHYSALIGISLWERQEEKWTEINNQTAKFKVYRERGRHREGRNGCLEENRKIKIQEGWERWKSGEMQIIYLRNSGVFILFISWENN